MKTIKTAFIQGRPSAHMTHQNFARSVNSDFHYVDFKMQWQDKDKSILYRFVSWIVCAITFPEKSKYDIFLVDNLHFMPVILKMCRLINSKQKIVVYLGSHTLYFVYAHKFSPLVEWLHKQALKRYDAVICEGKLSHDILKEIFKSDTPRTYTVINGIEKRHIDDGAKHQINLNSKNILFIGHGTGFERMWYKGLDVMMSAVEIAMQNDPEITFTIVGEWNEDVKVHLLSLVNESRRKQIMFEDETPNLKPFLVKAGLYLHCARGEAYGLSILIAMAYGIPTVISNYTGAKEVIESSMPSLISDLNAEHISKKIEDYLNMTLENKKQISNKIKSKVVKYTEENSISYFKNEFQRMASDFFGKA